MCLVIFIELFEKLQLRLPSSSERGYSVSSSVVLWLNASFGSGTKVFLFFKNALLCFFIIIVHFYITVLFSSTINILFLVACVSVFHL